MSETDVNKQESKRRNLEPSQWAVIALAIAFAAGAVLYRVLRHIQLGDSAAMFLGVPAVLAILLALAPKAESVTGGIVKGITLALLIVAPLLGEGYLCILLASPLFYAVGIVIGLVVDWQKERRGATLSCVAIVLLPMCLEGVVPETTFSRGQTVSATRIITASPEEVEAALTHSPRISATLPKALRVGFPRPLAAWGDGLQVGAMRTIRFSGAEGDPEGDLVMALAEDEPGHVKFEAVRDDSKLAQWLRWRSSDVRWRATDSHHTEVTWTVGFDRQLDPAWYFVPWEQAAVKQAAGYLILANATPEERTAKGVTP